MSAALYQVTGSDPVLRGAAEGVVRQPLPQLATRGDRLPGAHVAQRVSLRRRQHRRDVEHPGPPVGLPTLQEIDASDGVVERPQAERGEVVTHLVGDEEEIVLDHLRRRCELGS